MELKMYFYYLQDGEYSDFEDCTIVSLTAFTQIEFENLFSQYKKQNKVYNIWSFAGYLITNYNFFWPEIKAEINFQKILG